MLFPSPPRSFATVKCEIFFVTVTTLRTFTERGKYKFIQLVNSAFISPANAFETEYSKMNVTELRLLDKRYRDLRRDRDRKIIRDDNKCHDAPLYSDRNRRITLDDNICHDASLYSDRNQLMHDRVTIMALNLIGTNKSRDSNFDVRKR